MNSPPPFYRSLLVLTALALLTYLLGNASVVLWDRDEPRYAQTARQMLDSGDWVVPRLLDEPREKKPAMIYWLQATSMRMLGPTTFAARLPSAIFVSATILLIGLALRRSVGDELALITAGVLASSLLVIVTAKMAITDGVLLLFATAAQLSFFAMLIGDRRWRVFVLFGVAQGLALLTKGPVIPAVSMMTALAWLFLKKLFPAPCTRVEGGGDGGTVSSAEKLESTDEPGGTSPTLCSQRSPFSSSTLSPTLSPSTGRGRVVAGLLMATVIALVVFAPWWIAIEHRSPGWTWRVLHNEVINRATTAQENHKGPPGYYALTIWGTFLPWSLLLPAATVLAWKDRSDATVCFALAAIIGPWIMFEISATKLFHYLLPVFPALAFLVARWIVIRHWQRAAARTAVATFLIFAAIYAGMIPRIPELRLSKRLAIALLNDGATQPGAEMMIDYKENALVFYQGGTIRPQSENSFLLTHPPDVWPKWLVITDAVWKKMPPNIRDRWIRLSTVHGWLYAGRDADKNWSIDVHVLRKK